MHTGSRRQDHSTDQMRALYPRDSRQCTSGTDPTKVRYRLRKFRHGSRYPQEAADGDIIAQQDESEEIIASGGVGLLRGSITRIQQTATRHERGLRARGQPPPPPISQPPHSLTKHDVKRDPAKMAVHARKGRSNIT